MGSQHPATDFPLEGLKIRESLSADCYDLADRLRPADKRECTAHGMDPLDALLQGLSLAQECWTVYLHNVPVIMFGCGDAPANLEVGDYNPGVIWMLGAEEVTCLRKRFLRESRKWVDYFQTQYDCLTNFIDIRNAVHHRWLVWMGFTILQPAVEYGSHAFYRFVRFSPCVSSPPR